MLASATAPVEEVIRHGENGILFPFHQPERLAAAAVDALANPGAYDAVRQAARDTIRERYDFESVSLPAYMKLLD